MYENESEYRLKIVHNADDEEPDCCQCDFCCVDTNNCDFCGPEYGWAWYKRTEILD